MNEVYHEITACRVCGCEELKPVIGLGNQYVINFPDGDEPTEGIRAPLDMVICAHTDCSLVQLKHTVNPDLMYREYWYRSGVNQTMRDALADVTQSACKRVDLVAGDIAVDIGANDGTLLRSYDNSDLVTVGFEPASNLVPLTSEGTSKVINDYFNRAAFDENFPGRKAKIVTSIAMFYDLEDPNSFVADIAGILDDGGVWINQMNYLGTMLTYNAFDNISHEHLEYYSLSSLEFLLSRHDLEVFDVEQNILNGGSLRAYICKKGQRPATAAVQAMRQTEVHLKTYEPYLEFVDRLQAIKDKICRFISEERAKGKTVYVYGASTRGNTLLQYFGLDSSLLVAAAERNPAKFGKKMVGTNVPIISEEEARAAKPDYMLVLPWAFIDEFVKRETEFLSGGGKFIVPLPDFRLIGSEG